MDGGQAAAAFLAPRWRTVTGVVRSRLIGQTGGMAVHPGAAPGSIVLFSGGRPGPGEIRESWERLWVRRDGVFRVDSSLQADGEPFIVRRRNVDGTATVSLPGQGTRVAQNEHESGHGLWLLEPGALAAGWDLSFSDEPVEMLGRSAVRATGQGRRVPSHWSSAVGMLIGAPPGDRCELVVDSATGICLRITNITDGSVTAEHEFTEIAVDVGIDDSVGEWAPRLGERLRTHVDDLLDRARRSGVDVDDIDPESQTALIEVHERLAAGARTHTVRSPFVPSSPRRSLRETVAPLGPPPANRAAAVDAISEALAGLGPDDPRPRAESIEHGRLLDEHDVTRGGPPSHPMVTGPVRFELVDALFLTAEIALIEFRIDIGSGTGIPFCGRAVRRDGRWLISYETAAQLRGMAGRDVPPLDEGDRDH